MKVKKVDGAHMFGRKGRRRSKESHWFTTQGVACLSVLVLSPVSVPSVLLVRMPSNSKLESRRVKVHG